MRSGAMGGVRFSRTQQRGNALVFALLGLVLTALAATATLQARRLEQRRSAGAAEATILENLRNAVNAAIFEQVVQLQNGNGLTRNGVLVAPVNLDGELVWRPTLADLTAMSYLPPGWNLNASALNNAAYAVGFKRVPAGCAPANCAIEGQVVLAGPVGDGLNAGQFDGVIVGAILSRIGADSGVSLQGTPALITGFGNTWTVANPVPGTPAGVVAVRVGTASAAFSQFVRVNDTRDPNLAGNLTVASALSVGGVTTLKADATLAGAALNVNAPDGSNCVQVLPTGTVNIKCAGALKAITADFDNGGGISTSIAPGTLTTTGSVTVGDNLAATGSVSGSRLRPSGSFAPGSPCGASNEVAGNLVNVGLVLCAAGAWRAIVTQALSGQACTPDGSVAQTDGAGLLCSGGSYVPLIAFLRQAAAGQACTEPGATAVDLSAGETVLCRANPSGGASRWYRLRDMVSNLQWMASIEAIDGQVVAKPACGSSAGYAGIAALILTPMAEGSSDASFSRYAIDNGGSWTVYLRDSDGGVLQGTSTNGSATVIAQQYCYYP